MIKTDKLLYLKKPSWSSGPNPEDQINRKPDDRKNDQMTKKARNNETKSTVLNLISAYYIIYRQSQVKSPDIKNKL